MYSKDGFVIRPPNVFKRWLCDLHFIFLGSTFDKVSEIPVTVTESME